MNGLTLARDYYSAYGSSVLDAAGSICPGLSGRLSIGLAGEGSQCFGYDDEISQDHDFAPGFCVWMSDDDYAAYGPALQRVYGSLPPEFHGFTQQNLIAEDRLGVMSVSVFFGSLTGIPETDQNWLFLSESALASAVNGEIWLHGCQEFEAVRRRLQNFYPYDILRKKIAARAAVMSQAGQYNLLRMLQRGDLVAAQLAAARFTEAAISMIHLLNRRYTPFYKWAYRSLTELAAESPLAELTARKLAELPGVCILPVRENVQESVWENVRESVHVEDGTEAAYEITETICEAVAKELGMQEFSKSRSRFLQDHLEDIMSGIKNSQIRAMHPMADPAF